MSKVRVLRALVKQRLTAAAEDIFGLFERTIAEYEETLCRSQEENERQRRLLDAVFNPQLRLHRAGFSTEARQLLVSQEEVPPEQQQEWSPSLDQEDPPEPPHIKEEEREVWTNQKGEVLDITKFTFIPVPVKSEDDAEDKPQSSQLHEFWTNQEGEQLQGLEGADINKYTFTFVPVRTDNEEKPQSSQLHQRQTEQMETGADGEDCGGPEPDRNSHPDPEDKTGDSSETEVSDGDWEQTREPQSGLNCQINNDVLVSDAGCKADKKPFSCSECGKRWDCQADLTVHMRVHTGEKPFLCSVCGKGFSQKANLSRHMTRHTGEKPFSCPVCKKRFRYGGYVVKHMKIHTREKLFTLQTHFKTHTEEKQFSCPFCDRSFTKNVHLIRHVSVHIGEEGFSCGVCDKRFSRYKLLKTHTCVGRQLSQLHQSQTEENREAKPQTSSSTHQMETEAAGEDSGEPEPARDSHPDTYLTPDNKTESETDISDGVWEGTREPQSLLNSDKDNKILVLDEGCNTDKKPISCSECGKRFNSNYCLETHLRVHTGEKPFRCSVCGTGFSQKANLFRHMTRHTGEKPFSCSVCRRRFRHRGAVVRHMSTHAEERKFSCPFCGRGFTQEVSLMGHMSVHISDTGLNLNVCDKTFNHSKQFETHRDITMFPFTPLLKSEDEEKPHFSQPYQRQTQQETEADREDCGGPEPARNSHLDRHLTPETKDKTKDFPDTISVGAREEIREPQPGLNSLTNNDVSISDKTAERPFSCSYCSRTFTRRYCLNLHMRIHTGEKPYSCSVCGKRFTQKINLTRHMFVHLREKGYSCSVCDKAFSHYCQLKTHQCVSEPSHFNKSHTEENTEPSASSSTEMLKTEADGQDCGGPEPVRNSHPGTHLTPDTKTGCFSVTDIRDGDWKESREPQSGDVGCKIDKKPFSCSECGKGWGSQADLTVHMRVHTGEKPFRCSVCGKGFSQKANLVRHMTRHTGEKPFSCSVCKKCFRFKGDVVRHMKIHTREKPFSCSLSEPENSDDWKETREPQSASNSQNNNEVSVISDETAEKPLSCSDCGKTFSRRYCLNIHRRLHTGEKPYSCSICGKQFNQRNTFNEHTKRHTGQDTFNCSLCGKKFGYKFRLRDHMRTHTGERPLSCPVCEKGFRYNAELIAHMRRHSGEKPFSCSVCHKAFRLNSILKNHMKVHTGEKPFCCSVCGKRFTQQGNLGKHMTFHT